MDDSLTMILAYLRYAEIQDPKDNWAWSELALMPRKDPDRCFRLILKLLEVATTHRQLERIAVGPLETLLGYFPEQTFEKINKEIPGNLRLLYALRWVWNDDSPVDEYLDKIEATYGKKELTPEILNLTSDS